MERIMGDSAEKKPVEKKAAPKKAKKAGFFKGVKSEFKKISWPDKNSTFKQSVAVVSISIVVGIIIAILDYLIQYGVNFITTL
jgi:preprotein translocase subunit SecE